MFRLNLNWTIKNNNKAYKLRKTHTHSRRIYVYKRQKGIPKTKPKMYMDEVYMCIYIRMNGGGRGTSVDEFLRILTIFFWSLFLTELRKKNRIVLFGIVIGFNVWICLWLALVIRRSREKKIFACF